MDQDGPSHLDLARSWVSGNRHSTKEASRVLIAKAAVKQLGSAINKSLCTDRIHPPLHQEFYSDVDILFCPCKILGKDAVMKGN